MTEEEGNYEGGELDDIKRKKEMVYEKRMKETDRETQKELRKGVPRRDRGEEEIGCILQNPSSLFPHPLHAHATLPCPQHTI